MCVRPFVALDVLMMSWFHSLLLLYTSHKNLHRHCWRKGVGLERGCRFAAAVASLLLYCCILILWLRG